MSLKVPDKDQAEGKTNLNYAEFYQYRTPEPIHSVILCHAHNPYNKALPLKLEELKPHSLAGLLVAYYILTSTGNFQNITHMKFCVLPLIL